MNNTIKNHTVMKLKKYYFYLLVLIGFLLSTLFSIFSFGLTAPNLIFSSWQPYWQFQLYMWETLFTNRQLLGNLFLLIGMGYFIWFYCLVWFVVKNQVVSSIKNIAVVILAVTMPLLVSNTALSYDVFNYAFNAKMVVVYKENPHIKTALDFPQDDWLRFMHNVHTPAPYGQTWTYLSVIPYTVAGGGFTKTWFLLRLMQYGAYFALCYLLISRLISRQSQKISNHSKLAVALLVLVHPIVLIEILSSSHNDLWMLVPALFSLLSITRKEYSFITKFIKSKIGTILFLLVVSALALAFSISVKFATIVLIPVWLILASALVYNSFPARKTAILSAYKNLVGNNRYELLKKNSTLLFDLWPVLSSFLLFLPLLTSRSKFFLPWYCIWSLIWIPLFPFKNKIARVWASSILALSTSVLFRYLPFLLTGSHEGNTQLYQLYITWGGALVLFPLVYYYICMLTKKS